MKSGVFGHEMYNPNKKFVNEERLAGTLVAISNPLVLSGELHIANQQPKKKLE